MIIFFVIQDLNMRKYLEKNGSNEKPQFNFLFYFFFELLLIF